MEGTTGMGITSRVEAVKIIHESAVLYNKNLSGRNVMFITVNDNKATYFETLFQPNNFLHLTGMKTSLNSGFFFRSALNQRLSPESISFDPGGSAEIKLEILYRLMSIHVSARMIGDYDNSRPLLVTDKFAGTVAMAMGFVNINGLYIPNTALKLDVRVVTAQATRRKVAAIFIKSRADDFYKRLTYIAKGLMIKDAVLAPILSEKVDISNLYADFPLLK